MRKSDRNYEETNSNLSRKPLRTPEEVENHMINLATRLAEEQLEHGTASSSVINHYLELGTIKYKKELEKLEIEKELLKAKKEAIESSKRAEELYAQAIESIRRYSGHRGDSDEEVQ